MRLPAAAHDEAILLGRLIIAPLFLVSAYRKLVGYEDVVVYFSQVGFPAAEYTAATVILFETTVGALIVAGFQTRLIALLVAVFCMASAFIAHADVNDANQLNHFLKNLAIAGGALVLFAAGPGKHSVDARRTDGAEATQDRSI